MMELLIIAMLIVLNGFFSMSEMAVITSRKPRLRQMAKTSKAAARVLKLAESPEKFLSAVQVGITLISIVTGAFGGAALGEMLAPKLVAWGVPEQYSLMVSSGSMIAVVTFFTILFGELVPKRLALIAPEKIATFVSWPMSMFATLVTPFERLLSQSTRLVLKLLGMDKVQPSAITEEEIRMMVHEGHEQGLLDLDERNMMNRVMRLGDRSSESFMTPRVKIEWLDMQATVEENLEIIRTTPHARYPVYRGDDSDVAGVFEVKTLTAQIGKRLDGDQFKLFDELKPALFVSESTLAMSLLEKFRDTKMQMALVVDEYGDIQGLTTQNDVLSAVLGNLPSDALQTQVSEETAVTKRDDGSYLIDGGLSTEDLRELLALSELPNEDDYHTIAGMVVINIGRIPKVGEHIEFSGWRFEVVDLDGARVDKLLVSKTNTPSEASA